MDYAKYSAECERLGITNPYEDEKAYNKAYGIKDEYEPFIARKSANSKRIEPTLKNHLVGESKK